jgi:predicted RNase H-like HicB family nuclease
MSISEEETVHDKRILGYYHSLHYKMVIWWSPKDKCFLVELPELPGCTADGTTIIKAINMALKVKDMWLETAYIKRWEIPLPESLKEKPCEKR